MENKPLSNRIYSLLVMFDMQTTFLESALEGMTDKDAHSRLNTKANHVAWLTGSLIQQRYDLAEGLGCTPAQLPERKAAPALFSNHKGIQDNVVYPSLAEFKVDWKAITPVLRNALHNATEEALDKLQEMPGMQMSYFDLLTFCIYREANCIGQIALWRRLLGYEAMKYM